MQHYFYFRYFLVWKSNDVGNAAATDSFFAALQFPDVLYSRPSFPFSD